ncbi:MAG: hypothetical protein JXO22_02480 [Phycisphaerae bacterium]|nr:hypothetical protein [Phycisphaerae bacterium]
MNQITPHTDSTSTGRSRRHVGALIALLSLTCGLLGGCPDATSEIEKEFRAASGDAIESAFQDLASGVISGLFAIYEPSTDTTTQ